MKDMRLPISNSKRNNSLFHLGQLLLVLFLTVLFTARAADDGEVMASAPVSYKTYTFTPGKLTGKKFWLENIEKKEKFLCREFSFEEFLSYKKPEETASITLSLRGGYMARNLFGHDDFEPKEAQDVATGWVPQSGGNFLIYPDQSKEHLPKWIPERTRLIRVPLIKQYGDKVVNAYDLALGLDRFNKGEQKTIEFQLTPITDNDGKPCIRLVPVTPLTDGVYFAYSLPAGADTAIYGFIFAVGVPASGVQSEVPKSDIVEELQPGNPQVAPLQTTAFLKFPIRGEFDPWDAKLSALMDHDLTKDGKLKTFQGEGDTAKHITIDEKGVELKEGYDYFKKADDAEFNLGEISNYKESKSKFFYDGHRGYDFSYTSEAIVIAADSGVLFIPGMKRNKDYHAIAIKHDNGFVTFYLHLSKWDPKIEEYFNNPAKQTTRIKKGDVIGNPGGWGPKGPNHYGVHLHFEVHKVVRSHLINISLYF